MRFRIFKRFSELLIISIFYCLLSKMISNGENSVSTFLIVSFLKSIEKHNGKFFKSLKIYMIFWILEHQFYLSTFNLAVFAIFSSFQLLFLFSLFPIHLNKLIVSFRSYCTLLHLFCGSAFFSIFSDLLLKAFTHAFLKKKLLFL